MYYQKRGRSFLVVSVVVFICTLNIQTHVFADDDTGSMQTFVNIAAKGAQMFGKINDIIAVVQVTIPDMNMDYTVQMCSMINQSAESRIIGIIEKPSSLKGMTVLIHIMPDQKPGYWIYAPKTLRVRQIAGMDQASNLMGVSFNMEDMNLLSLISLEDALFRILPSKKVDGKQCGVIEKINDDNARFKKQTIYISENPVFPVKIDSFDKDNVLQMTYLFEDIRETQEMPAPGTLKLVDHINKRTTVAKIQDMHYNNGLQDTFFRLDDLKSASARMAKLWQKAKAK